MGSMSIGSSQHDTVFRDDEVPALPRSRLRIRVMTRIEHIIPWNQYGRDTLENLRTRSYNHAKIFDSELMDRTGLHSDTERAFRNAGWKDFYPVEEQGSYFLT